MGGVWDENKSDNFDTDGNYRLNEPFPVWTGGNIYFQDGAHVFGMHHLPFPGTNFQDIQTGEHKKAFNSLNNAEVNFWLDAPAVDKVLNSGIPTYIVPLNATNFARLQGFGDRIKDNPAKCATAPAQFIKNLQFVNFQDFRELEITTLTNGDPNTVTGKLPAETRGQGGLAGQFSKSGARQQRSITDKHGLIIRSQWGIASSMRNLCKPVTIFRFY